MSSCAQPIKEYSPLYVKDTLEINILQSNPVKLFVHECVNIDNYEYIRISDIKNKNLLLYNLNSKSFDTIYLNKLWNSITFGSLKSVFILNLDSIFVVNDRNQLLLIDKLGNINYKWQYPSIDNAGDAIEVTNHTNIYYFSDNKFLYFIQRIVSKNSIKEYSINNIVKVKLYENGKLNKINSFGPYFYNAKKYKSHEYPSPYLIYNSIDSLFILRFTKCDTFFVYKNERLFKAVPINSIYKTPFLSYDINNEKEDALYLDKFIIEGPSVNGLIWDKYRNFYYAKYKHKQDYKDENGFVKTYGDADFSILIFNKNFEKINEIVFKNNYYYDASMFVLKEGLAIGINHEFQPHIKENKLKFLILDIDKYVK